MLGGIVPSGGGRGGAEEGEGWISPMLSIETMLSSLSSCGLLDGPSAPAPCRRKPSSVYCGCRVLEAAEREDFE